MVSSTILTASALRLVKTNFYKFDATSNDCDNSHIFVDVESNYFPLKVIRFIKSITARKIFIKYF